MHLENAYKGKQPIKCYLDEDWSRESQVRILNPQLSLDLEFNVVRLGFLYDQVHRPQPDQHREDSLAPAGHVSSGAEKTSTCRKSLYTILCFRVN